MMERSLLHYINKDSDSVPRTRQYELERPLFRIHPLTIIEFVFNKSLILKQGAYCHNIFLVRALARFLILKKGSGLSASDTMLSILLLEFIYR
jgi:hypothetical protein